MAKIIIEVDDKQLMKFDRLVNFLEKFFENGAEVSHISPAPKPKKETKKQIQERMEKLATERYIKKEASKTSLIFCSVLTGRISKITMANIAKILISRHFAKGF